MPRSALTGTRIREERLRLGQRQAEIARRAGISASYLNLVEHNRRPVGSDLLIRLADALGVASLALSEGAEEALVADLRDAAAGGSEAAAETDRIEEFAGRFPGWAALVARQQGRIVALERSVEALNDRIAHDPHLSASLHEVLSAVTSVRSTAAILAETEEIDPDWRARFHRNLHTDSERLAAAAEALVAYLDATPGQDEALSSPQEELEAWLSAQGYHLPSLERSGAVDIEVTLQRAAELASSAARALARTYIERYRADARALPLEPFRRAVAELGPDPARLSRRFGTDLAPVFRRLASLPRPAPDLSGLPPIGLVVCDGSGTLTFRKPLAGFSLPRFGAACPLWPLYQALTRPMTPIRAVVETPGRLAQRFLAHAVCQPADPFGFEGPQVFEATMLIQPLPRAAEAGQEAAGFVTPVGSSCRICPRADCPARREPSILSETG